MEFNSGFKGLNYVLFLYHKAADGDGHALWRVGWSESRHICQPERFCWFRFIWSWFIPLYFRCYNNANYSPSDTTHICTYTKKRFIWLFVVVS